MCGIVGIVGNREVAGRLFDGLRRLEYRGYDSAGICTVSDGKLERRRAVVGAVGAPDRQGCLIIVQEDRAYGPAPSRGRGQRKCAVPFV